MTSLFRLLPLSFAVIGFVALVSAPSFSQSPNPKTLPIETVPSSGDRGEVTSVAFSPDGARVLSGCPGRIATSKRLCYIIRSSSPMT